MRFYDIKIKKNGVLWRSPSLSGAPTQSRAGNLFGIATGGGMGISSRGTSAESTYTSYVNGETLPGALNITLELPVYPKAFTKGGAVTIYGVSREEISQSTDLILADIEIYGGMKKGLPLANPDQSQMPIARGTIVKAFGNWIGTDQTLTFIITGKDEGRAGDNKNFSFEWRANTNLEDAIRSCMLAAIPDARVQFFISPDLKYDYDQKGVYGSLNTFSQAIFAFTNTQKFAGIKTLSGVPYQGVNCAQNLDSGVYTFYDDTKALRGNRQRTGLIGQPGTLGTGQRPGGTILEINFSDIIGQPTWIDANQMQFKTVMRSDLSLGDTIKLPEAILPIGILTSKSAPVLNPDGGLTPSRNKSTFTGEFTIRHMNHYGNFRQADAASWVTVITAYFNASYGKAETIPEGKVTVGEVTKIAPPKEPVVINPQQTLIVNPTPPHIINNNSLRTTISPLAKRPPPPLSVPGVGSPFSAAQVPSIGTFVFKR